MVLATMTIACLLPAAVAAEMPSSLNAALEIDRATGWTVIVLANDDPPMATRMAAKVRRLLDAIKK